MFVKNAVSANILFIFFLLGKAHETEDAYKQNAVENVLA
jgi:hypothetical protein